MFADEVADLKDAYPARMQIVHVLSREPQEVELHSGRLDAGRLTALLPATVDVPAVDHWWLCGPFGMVTDAIEVLRELGVDAGRIHRELFWVGDEPPAEATHEDAPVGAGASLTVILDGRSTTLTLPAGTPVLDGAQRARPDLPFACKGGVCGTCRAKVISGAAVMRRNYALEQREIDAGYVLTCQALPHDRRDHRRLRRLNDGKGQRHDRRRQPRRASLSPSRPPRLTSCGRCSLSGCAGRCGTPTTTCRTTGRCSTSPRSTPTTARTCPTSRSSRSPPRRRCATTTRSACSRCPASRWRGCTPRRAPPAAPPSSATPPRTSTPGPPSWPARSAPRAAAPGTSCTSPTGTACSPAGSARTTAPSGSAAPWSRSPAA